MPLLHRGTISRKSSFETCLGRSGVGLQCNAKCFILHLQSLDAPNAKEQEEVRDFLGRKFLTFKEAFAMIVKFKPERWRHTRKPEPSIGDLFIDSIFQRCDFTLFRLFTFPKEIFVVERKNNFNSQRIAQKRHLCEYLFDDEVLLMLFRRFYDGNNNILLQTNS